MKTHVLQALQLVYSTVWCLPLQEDLNDIAIGLKEGSVSSSGVGDRNESGDGCQGETVCSTLDENGVAESLVRGSLVADETRLKGEAASQQYSFVEGSSGDGSGQWNSDGVERGVRDLVSVIRENGGDVEGLESELIGFLMSKLIIGP